MLAITIIVGLLTYRRFKIRFITSRRETAGTETSQKASAPKNEKGLHREVVRIKKKGLHTHSKMVSKELGGQLNVAGR